MHRCTKNDKETRGGRAPEVEPCEIAASQGLSSSAAREAFKPRTCTDGRETTQATIRCNTQGDEEEEDSTSQSLKSW